MKGMWVICSVSDCSRLLSLSTEYLNQLFFLSGSCSVSACSQPPPLSKQYFNQMIFWVGGAWRTFLWISQAVHKFAEDFEKLQSFKMKAMWVNCSVLVCSWLLSLSREYNVAERMPTISKNITTKIIDQRKRTGKWKRERQAPAWRCFKNTSHANGPLS